MVPSKYLGIVPHVWAGRSVCLGGRRGQTDGFVQAIYGTFAQIMETQVKVLTILLSALGAFCLCEFRVFSTNLNILRSICSGHGDPALCVAEGAWGQELSGEFSHSLWCGWPGFRVGTWRSWFGRNVYLVRMGSRRERLSGMEANAVGPKRILKSTRRSKVSAPDSGAVALVEESQQAS